MATSRHFQFYSIFSGSVFFFIWNFVRIIVQNGIRAQTKSKSKSFENTKMATVYHFEKWKMAFIRRLYTVKGKRSISSHEVFSFISNLLLAFFLVWNSASQWVIIFVLLLINWSLLKRGWEGVEKGDGGRGKGCGGWGTGGGGKGVISTRWSCLWKLPRIWNSCSCLKASTYSLPIWISVKVLQQMQMLLHYPLVHRRKQTPESSSM